jgi:uncharacterized membrane protein YgcG
MIGRLLILLLLSAPLAAAQERTLYWRDVTVNAQLDADGKLHLEERQSMVFNGDWNGGERVFRIFAGQDLKLERLTRIDASTGGEKDLRPGSLAGIDEYNWADGHRLRWRSRLPADPPFSNAEITYVIRYTLSNILVPKGDRYLLDHDFVFPDRSGMIQRFSLSLTLDPAWRTTAEFNAPSGIGPLPPGQGYLVTLPLAYSGAGKPAGVQFPVPLWIRGMLLLGLATAILVLLVRFYRREQALGRFAPLIPASAINGEWVKTNVLPYTPELVGTLWDESVGAGEVAALLARLVCEGKLKSEVRHGKSKNSSVLHLWKLGGGFEGYEIDLVNALFFDGGSETDTDRVKEHYKNSGFDPASKISKQLEKQMKVLLATSGTGVKPSWKGTLVLVLAGLALILIGGLTSLLSGAGGPLNLVAGIIGASAVLVPFLPAKILASFYRKRLVRQRLHFVIMMIPLMIMTTGFALAMLLAAFPVSVWVPVGLVLLVIAAFNSVLNGAMSRENAAQILFRKTFAAAREYFRLQLTCTTPELQDAWYPYLLAFGLGESVDTWFQSYGGERVYDSHTVGSTGSFSGSGGGSQSWTGGGGAFGGAGASASWAAVAGTMAAGVAAPSSSSSGGGGGGGGSSGGGGGGGW